MSILRTNTQQLGGKLFSEKGNDPHLIVKEVEAELLDYSDNGLEVERNRYLKENQLDERYSLSEGDKAIIQNRYDENLNHLNQRKDHIVSHMPDQKQTMTFADREHARINAHKSSVAER